MKFEGSVPKVASDVPKFNNGHWLFPQQMDQVAYVGFIYVIRDMYMRRLYLGKKVYLSNAKARKGQDSGWRKYVSSSKELGEHLKIRPRDEFEFICLEQYVTKGTLSYSETWSLCHVEAPTNKDWFNTRVEAVSWPCREAITDRHKERLERILKWDKFIT